MESVIYEIEDRVAYVTINRPEAYNACDQATYDRLAEVWEDFAHNDEAWVAILTGAGDKAFCAGSDIKQNFNSAPEPANNFAAAGRGDLMRGLEIWKPVIAAVNGHCNGGGLERARRREAIRDANDVDSRIVEVEAVERAVNSERAVLSSGLRSMSAWLAVRHCDGDRHTTCTHHSLRDPRQSLASRSSARHVALQPETFGRLFWKLEVV